MGQYVYSFSVLLGGGGGGGGNNSRCVISTYLWDYFSSIFHLLFSCILHTSNVTNR